MRPPDERVDERPAHPGLLAEIMTNTLDQDYQVAADRARHRGRRRGSRTSLVIVIALLFGAMIGISALRTAQQRPVAAAERDQLVAQIHDRQDRLDQLHTSLTGLESTVAQLQGAAGDARALARRLDDQETVLAGTTGTDAVSGPGVRIVTDNAPGAIIGTTSDGVILDSDLQALVNGLWQAGAEAISVNGHRLTSLSAIRTAGRAITVNYRSLAPPYVIDAIGDPDTLPARLLETSGGQLWQSLARNFAITFDTSTDTDLELPANESATVRDATPAGSP